MSTNANLALPQCTQLSIIVSTFHRPGFLNGLPVSPSLYCNGSASYALSINRSTTSEPSSSSHGSMANTYVIHFPWGLVPLGSHHSETKGKFYFPRRKSVVVLIMRTLLNWLLHAGLGLESNGVEGGANDPRCVFAYLNGSWVKQEHDEGKKGIEQVYTSSPRTTIEYPLHHIHTSKTTAPNSSLPSSNSPLNGEFESSKLRKHQPVFAMEAYDKQESEAFLAVHSVSHRLKTTEEVRREEKNRRYLHNNAPKHLAPCCNHVLSQEHSELM
ncbi:hypothetical protein BKA70DRAFT_1434506 [Coprinopsis sp. MPI-PUGE-AT-0042]|nr:hypothetical protein BKA70DRAFT_1434506 [Coprinopsis sp. MPI-PUGE-AT-0042]